ncbi:right-handed parallel beta-helix repeat-containing protein [Halocalculus aciditolerans]|uniref:Pectate lyase n=1 Tax=Halocalculus aciditolerans TaxID=1383812 RepID=A0A830FAR1_9EURY|nr:right-handed parallel beta-helix repeat-containing protein [Halocalculus aciditolerans]GGL55900.1 pectate lyase [Halocalculus aciditolerans]
MTARRPSDDADSDAGSDESGEPSGVSRRAAVGLAVGLAGALAGCPRPGDPAANETTTTGEPTTTEEPTPIPDPRAYYVSPDGDDGNQGSDDQPFASLRRAFRAVAPGDSVYLRGGTHRVAGHVRLTSVEGTPNAPVTVASAPGEAATIDFVEETVGGLQIRNCEHVHVRDLTVENAPSDGVLVTDGSRNITIEDVVVTGSGGDRNASGTGVLLYDTTDCTVRRVVSRRNYDPSSGGGNADGFDVGQSPGAVVEDCVAHGNSDDGFDLWEGVDITLRRCVAFENGWDPDGNPAGDGNGFKLGGGSLPSGDSRVERCVAYRNRRRGFDDNTATRALTVYNCTAWDNPTGFRFDCQSGRSCPAHVLRNNLNQDGRISTASGVDDDVNSWTLDVDDPGFASTDPSSRDFLALTADSPAVDAGTDVGLAYVGDAPDLGAYERRSE